LDHYQEFVITVALDLKIEDNFTFYTFRSAFTQTACFLMTVILGFSLVQNDNEVNPIQHF
ncbi:MAG: hypothetical protein ABF716_13220, partial [Lacticaseibacillus paracasei]